MPRPSAVVAYIFLLWTTFSLLAFGVTIEGERRTLVLYGYTSLVKLFAVHVLNSIFGISGAFEGLSDDVWMRTYDDTMNA